MLGLIAKNQLGKLIETHTNEENRWPIFRIYPNKEQTKLANSPLRSFEINNAIIFKKEQCYKSAETIKIEGTVRIDLELYQDNCFMLTESVLLEQVELEINKGGATDPDDYELKDINRDKSIINCFNQKKVDLKNDYVNSEWKMPIKFPYNNSHIIATRKSRFIVGDWADAYSRIDIIITSEFKVEIPGQTMSSIEKISRVCDTPERARKLQADELVDDILKDAYDELNEDQEHLVYNVEPYVENFSNEVIFLA